MGMWRVVDRIHSRGDPIVTQLRASEVHQLRNTFLNDIHILCASRIAFRSDVTFLRMVHQRRPVSAFVPLLDAFDLDLCTGPNADTIDWTELENNMVRRVKTQFQVFEVRGWTAYAPFLKTLWLPEVANACIQSYSS